MEFLDEDARPRLLFQARAIPSSGSEDQTVNIRRPIVIISFILSCLLFAVTIFFIKSEPYKSLAFWFALSIFIGPLAPSSVTYGDIRVGVGRILEPVQQNDEADRDDSRKRFPNRRSRVRKVEELGVDSAPPLAKNPSEKVQVPKDNEKADTKSATNDGESDWTQSDFEILKKQLAKHPVGVPRRWEIISGAFQGRHSVESVVKTAKSLGEKKINDADSFSKFLKDRKPVDKRIDDAAVEESVTGGMENVNVSWSSGDDLALLNAMKAFPKEVSMRWEKISAAVPGKTKAACMKRITELKKDFRNSKNPSEA